MAHMKLEVCAAGRAGSTGSASSATTTAHQTSSVPSGSMTVTVQPGRVTSAMWVLVFAELNRRRRAVVSED